jgi:hypothetical protein
VSSTNPSLDSALADLADITLGQSPSIWPLAWGWWAIIIATIVLIAVITLLTVTYRSKRKIKRKALIAINKISENELHALRKLHAVLRAAVMHYYPEEDVSKLHGEAWQGFLISQGNRQKRVTNDITTNLKALESSLYTKTAAISVTDAKQSVATWLQCCLPSSNARLIKKDSEKQGEQHV